MSTRFERRTGRPAEKRQLSGIGSVVSSVIGNGNGNNGNGNGNGGNTAESTTSERTRVLPTTETTATTASPTTATTQTTPPPTTAPPLTTARPITTVPGSTITTVLTPSTIVVIGTSTITSALRPTTLTSSLPASTASALPNESANNNSSGLSSGARTGIIVGSVLGALALLALLVVLCLGCKRRRKNDLDRADNIRWPEVAASPDDRAALYPESTHPTGRAGLGGEMEETDGPSLVQTGAGAAGLGAFRNHSGSDYSRRQPTLPSIPAGVYHDEYNSHSYASTPYNSTEGTSYGGGPSSTQSHQPLAPGPASIEYHNNNSPPSHNFLPTRSGSSHGHLRDRDSTGAAGVLPMPGSSDGDHSDELRNHEEERSGTGSPTQGYNPTTRLSIVNPDGRY